MPTIAFEHLFNYTNLHEKYVLRLFFLDLKEILGGKKSL